MSLEEKKKVAGMEQAKADANIQYGISLLHPSLVKLIHSNPITAKKMGKRKPDFSQSLQAIIEDWILFFPTESKFAAFQTYFSRAKKVRHWVAHQSFDRNRYQHYMECLSMVATAIGQPNLKDIILNLVAVKDDSKEKQEKNQAVAQQEITAFHHDAFCSDILHLGIDQACNAYTDIYFHKTEFLMQFQ